MIPPHELFSSLPDDGYGLMEPMQLADRLKGNDPPFLLDIRKSSDWSSRRIPGSVHCEWEAVGALVEAGGIPADRDVVVVCYVGQSSGQVTGVLRMLGYRAYSLLDGFNEWLAGGLPTEDGGRS